MSGVPPHKDEEHRDQITGKIMDAFFHFDMSLHEKIYLDAVNWLLDEKDADLKEKHMRRIFDEIMESGSKKTWPSKKPVFKKRRKNNPTGF